MLVQFILESMPLNVSHSNIELPEQRCLDFCAVHTLKMRALSRSLDTDPKSTFWRVYSPRLLSYRTKRYRWKKVPCASRRLPQFQLESMPQMYRFPSLNCDNRTVLI